MRLHGFPRSIVSDRDSVFMSIFWRELFKLQGTKLQPSTTYHHQTDGQTEVTNRCLETYLRCFACDKLRQWLSFLPWAEYLFNTTYNASIKRSPFQVVYGRDPPALYRFVHGSTAVNGVQVQLQQHNQMLDTLKHHLFWLSTT